MKNSRARTQKTKTARTDKERREMRTELDRQASEIARLLVRTLKALRFSNAQILAAISEACDSEQPKPVRSPIAGRGELWGNVLCRWMEDPRFVDESGQPKVIPISGPSISFAALVREELPGTDPKSCLEGLIKLRSVARIGRLRVRLRNHATIYSNSTATFVEGVLLSVRELLRTVAWNLLDQPSTEHPRLFQRGVTGVRITEEDMNELQRMVNLHGMTLLELINGWANQRALSAKRLPAQAQSKTIQPYLGIYLSRGQKPAT